MTSKKSRVRASRRDRRKAKQSEYRREGTGNPRKHGHHPYDARDAEGGNVNHPQSQKRDPAEYVHERDTRTGKKLTPYAAFLRSVKRRRTL